MDLSRFHIAPQMSRVIPALMVFDLDGTLAESKQPLTRAMAHLLERLLEHTKVAVISGGAFPQFLKQVINRLPEETHFENLFILPTSGAAMYEYKNGDWKKVYEEHISENDAHKIEDAIQEAVKETGVVDLSEESWGPRTEYRGGQVSFSALGQVNVPIALKKAWDPDKSKRTALQKEIQKRLPKGYVAGMGGSTTIDIVKEGVDKAYGIHQLSKRLEIPEMEILYIGDELVGQGNDEAVFKTDARVHAVGSPTDTMRFLGKLLDRE